MKVDDASSRTWGMGGCPANDHARHLALCGLHPGNATVSPLSSGGKGPWLCSWQVGVDEVGGVAVVVVHEP